MAQRALNHSLPYKLWRVVRALMIAIGVTVTVSTSALGALSVFDAQAVAKLIAQLNQLKKNFEVLKEAKELQQSTVDAIGELGQITLPFINFSQLTGQLSADAACLKLDLENLFPSVEFESIDFGSICQRKSAYEQALLLDPAQKKNTTPQEYYALIAEIEKRRESSIRKSTIDALAQADAAFERSQTATRALNELRSQASGANDVNERLDILIRSVLTEAQIGNQTNQLLAQQLRVQSNLALALGVSIDEPYPVEQEEQGQ